jgi:hemoglobin
MMSTDIVQVDERAHRRRAGVAWPHTGNAMTSSGTGSEKKTLYDRLGGVYNIATVVDHFIDRIMVNPKLNVNPRVDEAHHKVPPAGFKYLVTEMLCWAAGGPQRYTGRDMGESHRDLAITATEWDAFMEDLQSDAR